MFRGARGRIRQARMDQGSKMPIARYFLFVGGALLALILALNAYMPSPVAANAPATEADNGRPVVRIHSAQKLPERIVIDTSIPTIVPAPAAVATAAEAPVKRPALDAMAQATPPEVTKSLAKKPEPKAPPKRKIAKRQVHQPMMAYAQAPRFDFDFFSHN
jgi:hypothetical protein